MSYKGRGGKQASNSGPAPDKLTQNVADLHLNSEEGGEWEVYSKKSKNKSIGADSARTWKSLNPNAKPYQDVKSKVGAGNNTGSGKASGSVVNKQTPDPNKIALGEFVGPAAAVSAPLEGGWNWHSRPGASQMAACEDGRVIDGAKDYKDENVKCDGDDASDSDGVEDSDGDFCSDDFDSDESEKSHETQKKSKWFKPFFNVLDELTVDEIQEPARQWHCPACQDGPGAIDWYCGLQPLMSHAITKGSRRVKLHRNFAKLLSEELRRRGTSSIPPGEAFGKWEGLQSQVKDHEIVWPPMVIIMNTKLELDESEKVKIYSFRVNYTLEADSLLDRLPTNGLSPFSWLGMGNQELLDYFSSYDVLRAKHSYGPRGHRGMSILIFEASAVGYIEAERLHEHFVNQKTDRYAWDHHPVHFYPGGRRQLYGYMARKEDMEAFNQHSRGKAMLKYDMRSYQEMVVTQLKQMSEENQKLVMYKDKVARVQRHSKAIEESFAVVTDKLRKTMEENRIVRLRTKMHHEQNKEELDLQEQFFKDQLQIIHNARDTKENEFEELQKEEREKVTQAFANSSTLEEKRRRTEVAEFIKSQDKKMEDFVAEREEIFKTHEEDVAAMKRRHMEEQIAEEKKFDAELEQLMQKYIKRYSLN